MYKILESFENKHRLNCVIEVLYVYDYVDVSEMLYAHIDMDNNIVHIYDSLQALLEYEFFLDKSGEYGYDEFNVEQYRGIDFEEWLKETYLE
jgi:hypothetical protein